jgi:hypothetical protein
MGKKREEPAVSTFNSNPESTCSPARNIEVAWTTRRPRVGVFEREQSLPLTALATNRWKAERVADADEVIHRSRREAHADMEINLLLLGYL